jgi:hypothetical protein
VGDIQSLSVWGAAAFLGALGIFLLAAMFPQRTAQVGLWFIEHLMPKRLHEKITGIMNKFLDGLASLRSPANVLMVFVTSVVIWLFETGKYWFVMHAFDFNVSFFALMLMNGIVTLATTIPSAPGYVGTFDKPGIAVLEAYGVGTAVATGYTLVLHIALWLAPTILGAYFMAREGITWSDDLRNEAVSNQKNYSSELENFYESVQQLINILNEAGHQEWAERFHDALAGNSNSHEILRRLKVEFIEFQTTNIPQKIGYELYVDDVIKWSIPVFTRDVPYNWK